jgi:hypothetical protein
VKRKADARVFGAGVLAAVLISLAAELFELGPVGLLAASSVALMLLSALVAREEHRDRHGG